MNAKRVNCRQCSHYYITWEAQRPHGCRMLRFKSAGLPSVVVRQSSGMPCLHFESKSADRLQSPGAPKMPHS